MKAPTRLAAVLTPVRAARADCTWPSVSWASSWAATPIRRHRLPVSTRPDVTMNREPPAEAALIVGDRRSLTITLVLSRPDASVRSRNIVVTSGGAVPSFDDFAVAQPVRRRATKLNTPHHERFIIVTSRERSSRGRFNVPPASRDGWSVGEADRSDRPWAREGPGIGLFAALVRGFPG